MIVKNEYKMSTIDLLYLNKEKNKFTEQMSFYYDYDSFQIDVKKKEELCSCPGNVVVTASRVPGAAPAPRRARCAGGRVTGER